MFNDKFISLLISFCIMLLVEFFVAHENQFVGSIPSSLGNVLSFQVMSLFSNSLTGVIPDTLCQLKNIIEIDYSNNYLTSTIPDCLTNMTNLQTLYIQQNRLQGTLPSQFGHALQNLLNVDLSYNRLSGTIPTSIAELQTVSSIILHSNRFSGNLHFLTNESLSNCLFFDVADNALSGNLPDELFRLPKLQYLLLSSNCFSGTIPESICDNGNIMTYSMNALGSGSRCDIVRIWKSYFPSFSFEGQIPACMWSLPSLETLYLSGNILTGDLEDVMLPDISPLNTLSLSGNALVGTLPTSLQTKNFSHLDLSWNKITGSLDDMEKHFGKEYSCQGSINLEVNYISGVIPHYILTGNEVQVLNGNLFECSSGSFHDPDLPSNDKSSDGYACGSSQFDLSMLLYSIVFVLSLGISLRLVYDLDLNSSTWLALEMKSFFRSYSNYLALTEFNPRYALQRYVRTLQHFMKVMCLMAVYVVVVFFIMIPILRNEGYSTSTHLFAWYFSFMYFEGLVPGVVYFLLWASLICYFSYATRYYQLTKYQKPETGSDSAELITGNLELTEIETGNDETSRTAMSIDEMDDNVRFIVLSLLISTFNFGCVLSANVYYITIILSEDVSQRYKIISQFALSIFMCFWNSIAVGFLVTRLHPRIPTEVFLRSSFRIVNTIFLPIIAVLISSSKCFSAFFFGLGDITNVVSYRTCSLQTFSNGVITCVEYEYADIEDSVEQPFVYSGGCTDAILSDYVPVHIYSYAFDFILMPVAYLISTTLLAEYQNYIILPKVMWLDTTVEKRELVRAGNLFGIIFGHFALALTFGLVSPVLIFVITVAFVQDLVIYIYYLRKYLRFSDRCNDPNDPFGGVDEACTDIPRRFRSVILMILMTSALVNTFFLLDKTWYTTYDSEHLPTHLWAILLPTLVVVSLQCVQWRYRSTGVSLCWQS